MGEAPVSSGNVKIPDAQAATNRSGQASCPGAEPDRVIVVASGQPTDRRVVDGIAAGDVGDRLATAAAIQGLPPPMGGELRPTPETDAPVFRALTAFTSSRQDEFALEFG